MRLRWHITRQWWALWTALMVVSSVSAAEFMVDITPAVMGLRERTRRNIECVEARMANARERRRAYRDALRRERARECAVETARERGGTV